MPNFMKYVIRETNKINTKQQTKSNQLFLRTLRVTSQHILYYIISPSILFIVQQTLQTIDVEARDRIPNFFLGLFPNDSITALIRNHTSQLQSIPFVVHSFGLKYGSE